MADGKVQEMLAHYNTMLELYRELEAVSDDIIIDLRNGEQVHNLTRHLKLNMEIAEKIREESRIINQFKEELAKSSPLTSGEREQVRIVEQQLTALVNRVVEQGNQSRELMNRQGVKISRR